MKFLDHLFGKLGLRPDRLTDKHLMLAKQAEWDVDMRGHPDLEHARLAQAQHLDPALPQELLANARMLQTLGPDSPTLKRLAERRRA